MKAVISKWGDNLGIEIPAMITETLGLQAGDQVDLELKDSGILIKKLTTAQMFEQFYGKPFSDITPDDIGSCKEIDWGEDAGGEIV